MPRKQLPGGLGLRARLTLAFLSIASFTGLAGAAGVVLTLRSRDQVAYLTEIVGPLRSETSALVGQQQALRRALLNGVSRLPGNLIQPEESDRTETLRHDVAQILRTGEEGVGRLGVLAERGGLTLPLAETQAALGRAGTAMAALLDRDQERAMAQAQRREQRFRFQGARRLLDEHLGAVAAQAEAEIAVAEERGKTEVQSGTADADMLAGLLNDTLTDAFPRLHAADRVTRILVHLDELATSHAAQTTLAALGPLEADAEQLLRGATTQIRRLAPRLRASADGWRADQMMREMAALRAALLGQDGAFARGRQVLEQEIAFETGRLALRISEQELTDVLSAVEQVARGLEHRMVAAARRSTQEALVAFGGVAVLGTLAAVALGLVLARRLTGPLLRLQEAVAAMAEGRAVTGLADLGGGGEIAAVAASVLERSAHMATHDALTGLPNRALFRDRLTQAMAAAQRDGTSLAVLYLDLDRFKEVNDTLGHAAGDKLLVEVASRLKATLRESDTLARLGGDEFAIVQRAATQPDNAESLAVRLVAAIAEPFELDGHQVSIGVSVGASMRAPVTAGLEAGLLLQEADLALYRAKEEGRGTFRLFQQEMNQRLQERRALEADLRQALSDGQLHLHYQPQVGLDGRGITGAEALLRWRHPERGDVRPDQFIALAEETGLIVPIGEWVLRTACRQAAAWPALGRIAVNVSPVQFRKAGFVQMVRDALAESGLAAKRLELEITEGILLHDTEDTLRVLGELRALGVSIAMDDFGTGYSSLGYLRKFRFDKIKIDRSFVRGLGEDADAAAIVRAVLGMSRALGIRANAEGVEDGEQVTMLRGAGCEEGQGYLYGRPMSPVEFGKLLAEDGRSAA